MSLNGPFDESIFYKENKTPEEAKQFWKMFFEKFKPRVEELEEVDIKGQKVKRLVFEEEITAGGFVFPKLFKNDNVVLEYPETGLKWIGKFPFKHAVFKKDASFTGATFEGMVSFYGAVFEDDAYFDNTTFEGYVSFDRVVFNGVTRFKEAKFKNTRDIPEAIRDEVSPEVNVGHANPTELDDQLVNTNKSYQFSATFVNAEFMDRVSFNNAEFQGAIRFNFSKFGVNIKRDSHTASIEFKNAKFLGPSTEFTGCTFFARTLFVNAKFGGYVNFNRSTFEQSSHFDRSEFLVDVESKDVGYFGFSPIDFRGAHFRKDASFRGVEFYSKPNFSKAHFEGSVAFTRTIGTNTKECIFHRGADFVECVFEKEADFQWCIFLKPNITVINPNYEYPQTSFAHSIFKETAFFIFAEFGKAIFNFSTFEKGASFNNAKFGEDALFWEITTLKPLEFNNSVFKSKAEFLRCKFRDAVEFSGTSFNDVFFDWSLFEGIAELTAIYHGKVSFKRSMFYLGVQIDWDQIMVVRIDSKKELIRIYVATLKQEGRIREATKVAVKFKKELNQYQRKKGRLRERIQAYIEWIILDLPTEYLTNWRRALVSSFMIIIIFGFLYWGISFAGGGAIYDSCCVFSTSNLTINTNINFTSTFNIGLNGSQLGNFQSLPISNVSDQDMINLTGCIRKDEESETRHLLDYLYFSLVTFTTLGYGDFHPGGVLKIFAGLEAFLGVLFAAMISAILGKEVFVEEFEE